MCFVQLQICENGLLGTTNLKFAIGIPIFLSVGLETHQMH